MLQRAAGAELTHCCTSAPLPSLHTHTHTHTHMHTHTHAHTRMHTTHTHHAAISHFFTDGSSNSHRHLIDLILDKLRVFAHWFTCQTTLKLFATSLLIVYEGDTSQPIPPEELLDIRLVDFAHTYERDPNESGLDENALFGLTNFILFLQKLQEDLQPHH